jgi:hypothetical protein
VIQFQHTEYYTQYISEVNVELRQHDDSPVGEAESAPLSEE